MCFYLSKLKLCLSIKFSILFGVLDIVNARVNYLKNYILGFSLQTDESNISFLIFNHNLTFSTDVPLNFIELFFWLTVALTSSSSVFSVFLIPFLFFIFSLYIPSLSFPFSSRSLSRLISFFPASPYLPLPPLSIVSPPVSYRSHLLTSSFVSP